MSLIIETLQNAENTVTALSMAESLMKAEGMDVPAIIADEKKRLYEKIESYDEESVKMLNELFGSQINRFLDNSLKSFEGYTRYYKDSDSLIAMFKALEDLAKGTHEAGKYSFTFDQLLLFILDSLKEFKKRNNLFQDAEAPAKAEKKTSKK